MARLLVLAGDYAGDDVVVGEAGPYVELVQDQDTAGWTGVCGACRWRSDQETARCLDLDRAHAIAAIHVDNQCLTREES